MGRGQLLPSLDSIEVHRWPNPVGKVRSGQDYAEAIVSCCLALAGNWTILRVVAATAGEVAPSGRGYRIVAAHLAMMANTEWLELVEKRLGCPLMLVNDAEAFLLGVSVGGHLPVRGNVAGLVVGTGLGFSLLRDGRWWKPARRLSFLGSVLIPKGEYDAWASAVRVSQICGADIASLLSRSDLAVERKMYLDGLSRIIASATALFFLDQVVLGGGLSEAATSANFPLASELQARLGPLLLPGLAEPVIEVVEAGNMEVLRGAMALASGLATADGLAFKGSFEALSTEGAGVPLRIEEQPPGEISRLLAEAESEAAVDFLESAPLLGEEARLLSSKLIAGGRVVYVGAGTSGRIGAIDAVEIPCTFGLARERFVAVIAGGISDAALSVEGDSEEDCSAVPDLIPLQLGCNDFVVGISASGTAFFVRSALAYARALGAHTLMLHEAKIEGPDFFDAAIRLRSGCELVRGSTRMKAGTATKKALNILSTTAMVLMGKVKGGYMIDLECSNRKLKERAARILADLEKIPLEEAIQRLAENMGSLPRALSGCCRAGVEKPQSLGLIGNIFPGSKKSFVLKPADMDEKIEGLRQAARFRMEIAAGALPGPERRCPLAVTELESFSRDGIRYRKLRFNPEPGDDCQGWLLENPEVRGTPAPAMLCLHQTTKFGKDEPAGLGGLSNLHYALELAHRGYITFAPDYPRFGESRTDPYALGYESATMKGIWNHLRSVDLLAELPGVDPARIGVIGHSLGGHNALFLAAFDPRVRIVVSSCGFTRFTKSDDEGAGTAGDLKDWSHRGLMPLIASEFACRAENMPFDFPEILLAILPRPIFINAPLGDFFAVEGVRECLRVVKPFYTMFQAADRLIVSHPPGGHDFPPEIRTKAYEVIERFLCSG